MCGKRLSGLVIDQLLRIAVVGSDEHLSVYLQDGIHDPADAFVDSLFEK